MTVTASVPFNLTVAGTFGGGKMTTSACFAPTSKHYPQKMTADEIRLDAPCLFDDVDQAVEACVAAQIAFAQEPLARRKAVIEAIRATALKFAEDFALAAWSETGRGRYEDKLTKQKLAAKETPGLEDLVPRCYTGDCGMTTVDLAPYGVLGAVTPVTNPTATIINNAITILAGGNGVVFNPHPGATLCTNRAVAIIHQAIVEAGGRFGLIASIKQPTIPSGQRLLSHPKTAANLVTGGPAVVKVALAAGKKSFCAGPGNPPVVVDDSANIKRAAAGIYNGASFDNNMICSDEKEIFVVESIADKLIQEMRALGAYIASEEECAELTKICIPTDCREWHHGAVDKDLVGMNANVILAKIGVKAAEDCRLIICDVPKSHPLVWTEQLMPVMPLVRVKDFNEALELAIKAEYGYRHTASIYSSNLDSISIMGKRMGTSIFVVNGSHTAGLAAGGEGYTSFSIAGYTGEGLTRPSTFTRERRMVCVDSLRFV